MGAAVSESRISCKGEVISKVACCSTRRESRSHDTVCCRLKVVTLTNAASFARQVDFITTGSSIRARHQNAVDEAEVMTRVLTRRLLVEL